MTTENPTPTDPTTLRTALEALVGLVDCYGLDHYGGDWGCAECHPDSDMLVAGFQCGLHLARAALATPAPATDPTTLRTALEALIADGIEAFRLTREYVGDDVLPDEPGWSWFDWAQRARAALATPAPAADEARCGHRNISFSEVGCVDCGRLLERDTVMTDAPQVMHTNPAPTPAPPTPPATEERVTHGRHCRCTPCRREDWTNPNLAHCGMHGPSCPPVYAPIDLTPPATEPVAALVDLRSRFVRDLQDDNMGLFDGEMPVRLDAIVAAALTDQERSR